MVSSHHTQVVIHQSAADVAALFTARPATWLSSFLRLSTMSRRNGCPAGVDRRAPWYHLGAPRWLDGGIVASTLTWWPHVSGHVFDRFRGEFWVSPHPAGAMLELIGVSDGGDPERNAAVLRALVRLIGTALSAGQPRDK